MTDDRPPTDPAAVHRGLLAIARNREADFNAILLQYAIERLLDRLSRSVESQRFVLKGAMLFRVWTGELYRPMAVSRSPSSPTWRMCPSRSASTLASGMRSRRRP